MYAKGPQRFDMKLQTEIGCKNFWKEWKVTRIYTKNFNVILKH